MRRTAIYVFVFEAQQPHAPASSARFADFVGVNADHLAVLGDDQ